MSDHTQSNDALMDNAATASQHKALIDDPVVREAVEQNCLVPLRLHIAELEAEKAKLRQAYEKLLIDIASSRVGHFGFYSAYVVGNGFEKKQIDEALAAIRTNNHE